MESAGDAADIHGQRKSGAGGVPSNKPGAELLIRGYKGRLTKLTRPWTRISDIREQDPVLPALRHGAELLPALLTRTGEGTKQWSSQ